MCPDCEGKISLKKAFIILAFIFIPLLVFKTYASSGGDSHKNHGEMESQTKKSRASLDDSSQKEILNILTINEDLHKAFFDYDAKKVEQEATRMKLAIDKLSNAEIAKLLKFSSSKLASIKSTSSREDNNQNYHLVSMALIHIISKYNTGADYSAYSCPMVKKKWIQNSKKMAKVHNPYAPKMPDCGSKDS